MSHFLNNSKFVIEYEFVTSDVFKRSKFYEVSLELNNENEHFK